MFTGIVEELGTVKNIRRGNRSIQVTIHANKVVTDVTLGDSIAVNGTCLTVVDYSRDYFTADVMPESMNRTAMKMLKTGDKVNLERALRLTDRLGGHIVSGHIDGVGEIRSITTQDIAILFEVEAAPSILRYIIPKGSIAIDGISLTVVEVTTTSFLVSIIPHTAAQTTLSFKRVGDSVNLENDIIGKYVEKLFCSTPVQETTDTPLSSEFLKLHGFA